MTERSMDLHCINSEKIFVQEEVGSDNCPLCDSTFWITVKPLTDKVTDENHQWIPNVLLDSPDELPELVENDFQETENNNLAPNPAKITAKPR